MHHVKTFLHCSDSARLMEAMRSPQARADLVQQNSWIAHCRHELYTPLNAIQGYSELLIEEIEDSEAISSKEQLLEKLDQIVHLNQNLVNLISQKVQVESLGNQQCKSFPPLSESRDQVQLWLEASFAVSSQSLLKVCMGLQPIPLGDYEGDIQKIIAAAHRFQTLVAGELVDSLYESNLQKSSRTNPIPQSPKQKDASQASVHEVREQTNHKSSANHQAHILVVDNNSSNRDLLGRYIVRQGYSVTEVEGGHQAIEQITSGIFDLILLDVLMPEVNGYQVLEWLQNSPWRHLPVIMISSLDEMDSVVKCIEMGAEDYLSKPFSPTLLKARVDACLEKKWLRDQEALSTQKLAQANHEITILNQKLEQENLRLNAELEITRKLQQMILPKELELKKIKDLEIAGFMTPAEEVGGDYYDVIHHGDIIQIGIGDVTGHGLESGVLMLMVQTTIRTLIETGETHLGKILDIANRTIFHNIQRMEIDKNLTLTLVAYHQGCLNISGQHEEVIIIRNSGIIDIINTVDLGIPIGLEEDISDFIGQAQVCLEPGELVILYTDGVTEAESKIGQLYGIERMCNCIQKNRHQSAHKIQKAIIDDLYQHISGGTIYDDITLLVIKRIT